MITATRFHDFSMGHRVAGHESKCAFLHGHNYRIHFTCKGTLNKLDVVGRVIDFSVIKSHLCEWLESNWDHRMILWDQDPMRHLFIAGSDSRALSAPVLVALAESLVIVPFNPTAEQIAWHLLYTVGPAQLVDTGVTLTRVVVEETRKCSAAAEL